LGVEAEIATGARARVEAFLRAVLSASWVSLASLAVSVVGDTFAGTAQPIVSFVAAVGCTVGMTVCRARVSGRLVGLTTLGICMYAWLVALFLLIGAVIIP